MYTYLNATTYLESANQVLRNLGQLLRADAGQASLLLLLQQQPASRYMVQVDIALF